MLSSDVNNVYDIMGPHPSSNSNLFQHAGFHSSGPGGPVCSVVHWPVCSVVDWPSKAGTGAPSWSVSLACWKCPHRCQNNESAIKEATNGDVLYIELIIMPHASYAEEVRPLEGLKEHCNQFSFQQELAQPTVNFFCLLWTSLCMMTGLLSPPTLKHISWRNCLPNAGIIFQVTQFLKEVHAVLCSFCCTTVFYGLLMGKNHCVCVYDCDITS